MNENFRKMLRKYGSYHNYIGSYHWRNLREQRILLDGGQCSICGSHSNLECHHLTYDHIATEQEIDDIITLCSDCHKKQHSRRIDVE